MSGGVCPRTDVRHNIIIIMYNSNSNVFKNGIDRNISDFLPRDAMHPQY